MTKSTLMKKKKAELIELADRMNIRINKSSNKDDIVSRIIKAKKPKSSDNQMLKSRPVNLTKDADLKRAQSSDSLIKTKASKKLKTGIKKQGTIETYEIPEVYNETKIVLMIRDPYWAYTYWEINDDERQKAGVVRYKHNKKMILRVYDVTDIVFNRKNAHSFFDISINDYTLSWYIKLPSPDRDYLVEIGYINDKGDFISLAQSNTVKSPRDTISTDIDEEWMDIDEPKYRELYSASGGYRLKELSGSEMIGERGKDFPKPISSPGIWGSGHMMQTNEEKDDFWLRVDTELIVYGATQPDANVTVQGKQINLKPDGTFSIRFSLPDGEQVIPVEAKNSKGNMKRKITPQVNKTTS